MSSLQAHKGKVCPTCQRPLDYVGRVVLLANRNSVMIDAFKVDLTPNQMQIFKAIMQDYPDVATYSKVYERTYSRQLANELWRQKEELKIVTQQVTKMRRKLENTALRILAERGLGYRIIFIASETKLESGKGIKWLQKLKSKISWIR